MKNCIIVFLFIFIIINGLIAGSDFLLINNSPESSGKGNTGVAEFSDISYALINPASTSKLRSAQFSFSYLILNNTMNYNYFSGGYPLGTGILSIHCVYVSLPDMNESLGGEDLLNSLNYKDICFIVSDSFKIGDFINGGLSFKYIKREIVDVKASAYAIDVGLIKSFNIGNYSKNTSDNFSIGFSLKNIGNKIQFVEEKEDLPLTYVVGVKYSPYKNLSLLYDANKEKSFELKHYIGAEYKTPFFFIPRVGVKLEEETIIMTGMGLQYAIGGLKLKCDYAYNLLGQEIKNHAIALNLEIGTG